MENPGPDDRPLYGRASALEYYKEAISYFMPNRLMAWNVVAEVGNTMKSSEVNDLIKGVKKKQVCKLGKPSRAYSAFEKEEFNQLLSILQLYPDIK